MQSVACLGQVIRWHFLCNGPFHINIVLEGISYGDSSGEVVAFPEAIFNFTGRDTVVVVISLVMSGQRMSVVLRIAE